MYYNNEKRKCRIYRYRRSYILCRKKCRSSPSPPFFAQHQPLTHHSPFFQLGFVYFLARIQINSKSLHLISAKNNLWDSFFSGFLTIVLRKLNWSISFLSPVHSLSPLFDPSGTRKLNSFVLIRVNA